MAGITLPAEGWEEAFGVGKESSYGSAASPTFWLRNASLSLKKSDPLIPLAGTPGVPWELLYSATRPRGRFGIPQVQGDLVFELELDDIGFFFEQLYGTGSNASATEETHTFSAPVAPTQMPASFTITRRTGADLGSSKQSWQFTGCVLTQLVFRGQPNQIIRVTASFVAQNAAAANVSLGSFSAAPWAEFYGAQFRHDVIGNVPDSGDALTAGDSLISFTQTLTRPLLVRQLAGDNERGIAEPQLNGAFVGMQEIEKDYRDATFQDIGFAATVEGRARSTSLFFDGNEQAGSGANFSLEIRQKSELRTDTGDYGGGFGPVTERVSAKAQYDGTNPPVTVVLVNETAAGSYSS